MSLRHADFPAIVVGCPDCAGMVEIVNDSQVSPRLWRTVILRCTECHHNWALRMTFSPCGDVAGGERSAKSRERKKAMAS